MEVRHYQRFCDLVRAIRRKHRLSQRALARALRVSSGYIGQWELRLSQPSPEMAVKLCRTFNINDVDYVQRLAYASRAPEWLRESILNYDKDADPPPVLTPLEKRILQAVRRLPAPQLERITERVEGWVEALLEPAEAGTPRKS